MFENDAVPISELSIDHILNSRYQPGWIIIESLCKEIDNFVVFQFLVAVIFHSSLFYFIYKSTKYRFTYILIYFLISYLYLSTDILRESIAIGFFLVGMRNLMNRQFSLFFFYILLGFLFHFYALFWLILAFIYYNRTTRKIGFYFACITILLTLLLKNATQSLNDFLNIAGVIIDFDYAKEAETKLNVSGYIYFLFEICLLFIVYTSSKIVFKNNFDLQKIQFFRFVILFYIYILIIRIAGIPFIARFFNYVNLYFIYILVEWLFAYFVKFQLKLRVLNYAFTISVIFTFYIIPFLKISKVSGVRYYKIYTPYYSIFSKKIDDDREKIIKDVGKL